MDTFSKKQSYTQAFAFLCCWLGGAFAGMNANIFSLLLPQVLPDLIQTTDRAIISQIGSYILFAFLIGWMVGGFIFGVVADRLGRVKAMSLSICFYAIFTGLAGMTTSSEQLLFCRFFAGIGVGGEMLCISIFLAETWSKKSRALAIGAGIASYQAGVFVSGFVSHLFSEWRIAFECGFIPVILAIVVQKYLKESKTWKESSKQLQSFAFLTQVKTIFQSEYRLNILIGSVAFGGLLVGYWASLFWIPSWIQDLAGTETGSEKNIATMIHGVAAVIGCLLAGYLADRWGRVTVILFSFIGAFLISSWMFLMNDTFSYAIYFQDGLLGLFIGIAQAVMYIYLPELFPTSIRGTSVGFCLNSGRLVTAILVIFVGVLVTLFGGYAYTLFAFSCIYLIGAAAVLKTPKKIKIQVLD